MIFFALKHCKQFSDMFSVENSALQFDVYFRLWKTVRNSATFLTGFQRRKWHSNYDSLSLHRENVGEFLTVFQSRKSSSNYDTSFFHRENTHHTKMRFFFPQRKCCWISYWFSDSKIMRFLFDWENVDEFSTVFQNRKWSSNYDALFFHRKNDAEFLVAFQRRK